MVENVPPNKRGMPISSLMPPGMEATSLADKGSNGRCIIRRRSMSSRGRCSNHFKTGDCPIPGVNASFSLASNGAKHKLHIKMARASFPSHIPRFDNGIAVT
ncbi:hypothetical protein BDV09DRAFT_24403 [Aspergillus tetrazonus]